MVHLTKQFLSGSIAPLLTHPIPKTCSDAKTIVDNQFSLFLFPDKTRLNSAFLETVLPTLMTKNFTKEQCMTWWRNLPEGSFLEFDKAKKFLYLCSVTA